MWTGTDLKAAREALKESQAEFAKRFGVDQATIARWEQSGPPQRGAARQAVANLLDALRVARKPEAA